MALLSIRPADASHVPGMLAVQEQCYPTALHESASVFLSILQRGSGHCYVLVDDDDDMHFVAGYLLAHPWHDVSCPPCLNSIPCMTGPARCIFIHDMVVLPAYRGCGFGKALLDCLLPSTYPVTLCAIDEPAASFWAKMGFVQIPTKTSASVKSYGPNACYMSI